MTHYQELRRKILFLVFFLSHHIYADEIHSRICTFATPYQTTLDMKRSQILRLRVVQPVMVELYSGERLIGTLNSTQDGVISRYKKHFHHQVKKIYFFRKLDFHLG